MPGGMPGGMPGMDQMGAMMEQVMQNPQMRQMAESMMQNPQYQAMMQNMMGCKYIFDWSIDNINDNLSWI